ncbi:branched-chain amino acid transport system II carrier protein [Facklamia sp. DSM 111018]|uniref:Branched-chain amino acid transport system carrier protein n=1 Tax=Facklamia lactis TaxID=2749967 RepID=A0ABS0LMN6_9LACT|nr:branched-chain amino acid transport system II carrier protein [Facklamia lactis]MBG9979912.1 branched-chain amino acid transport system II carrier protein [Facklamia lactis]MBG9985408.1 branched-chain amino acid transport system II carrier protein [Facklamia lactis]
MKNKLTFKQTLTIGSLLFGLFFGAGNVIFPLQIGQDAGNKLFIAGLGFLLTATGFPLLAVNAQGVTQKNDLLDLSQSIHPKFGWIFTLLLYLTIGPLFAIPRLASVSFQIGILPWISKDNESIWLAIFSIIFFAIIHYYSLKPGKIIDIIGKVMNPLFLIIIAILFLVAITHPLGTPNNLPALNNYQNHAFMQGFTDGYQTMDAIAGLAFGIIVVRTIKSYQINNPKEISLSVLKSGIISSLMMAIVYIALIYLGAMQRHKFSLSENGGDILTHLIFHYFGNWGGFVLLLTITLACFKTGIGLVTACAEMAEQLFPKTASYKQWVSGLCITAFLVANLGLNSIISLSLPVLNILYPYTITLIVLANISPLFRHKSIVYLTAFSMIALYQILDQFLIHFNPNLIKAWPLYSANLGWLLPAIIGASFGFIIYRTHSRLANL